ncbi:hypothetical protein ACSU64_20970 [Bacillaceae bacterium C204]|uniref:hypothetical protein n=1 Tax=Neobacillus sp. 204 TaxID=3383351 RepID=UPI00397D31A9
MKITKEKVTNNEPKKERGFQLFSKPETEKTEDKVTLKLTKAEYSLIMTVCVWNGLGYKSYVKDTIEGFDGVTEIVLPETGEEPVKDWLTFSFPIDTVDRLIRASKQAGMTVEMFVRSLVYTRTRQLQQVHQEQEVRRQEQMRKRQLKHVHLNLSLNDEMITKYEKRFGAISSTTDVETTLKDLLMKELG